MKENTVDRSKKTKILMFLFALYNISLVISSLKMSNQNYMIFGPFLFRRYGVIIFIILSVLVYIAIVYGILRRTKWCIILIQVYYVYVIARSILDYFSQTIGRKKYVQNFKIVANDLGIDENTLSTILDNHSQGILLMLLSLILSVVIMSFISKHDSYFSKIRVI